MGLVKLQPEFQVARAYEWDVSGRGRVISYFVTTSRKFRRVPKFCRRCGVSRWLIFTEDVYNIMFITPICL